MATRQYFRVTVNTKGMADVQRMLDAAKKAFDPALIQDAILPAGMILRNDMKRRVRLGSERPRQTSGWSPEHLRDAIFATKGKRGVPDIIVGVDTEKAPQAFWVEFGTVPHLISPKPPKRLLFIPDYLRFVPFVRHPGAKKAPFFRPAIRASKRRMAAAMEQGLRKLLDRALPRAA